MRQKYEREQSEPEKKSTILDLVRDEKFKAKHCSHKSRLRWFGDPEFRRDEMEEKLDQHLRHSQRISQELRSLQYDPSYNTEQDLLSQYHASLEQNQDLSAHWEAAAKMDSPYTQPLMLEEESAPITGYLETYPERDLATPPQAAAHSCKSTGESAVVQDSDLMFNPETSMLFEPQSSQQNDETIVSSQVGFTPEMLDSMGAPAALTADAEPGFASPSTATETPSTQS